jgi:BirA family transcriptional regulator, biotin operon repressor / biotin---[acetyl-CoA-carboxylase] ligase
MEMIGIKNPFPGASSFLIAETESTQEEARRLAELGYPPGSLVAADAQTAGRGRFPERSWEAEAGKNLLFTIYLDAGAATLPGLPLRVGLALCAAVSDYAFRLGTRFNAQPRIKWPNDLLLGDRKAAGILCEAGAGGVFAGVGLNCNQSSFPAGLEAKATSLSNELGREVSRWAILERFLELLELTLADSSWREEVNKRLWRRGEELSFLPGASAREGGGEGRAVIGVLEGVDESGALLLRLKEDGELRSYPAGELTVAPPLYKVEP